jgi:hypothetical protein
MSKVQIIPACAGAMSLFKVGIETDSYKLMSKTVSEAESKKILPELSDPDLIIDEEEPG